MVKRIHKKKLSGLSWPTPLVFWGVIVLAANMVPVAAHGESGPKPIHMLNLKNIYIGFNEKDAQLTYQVIMNKVIGNKYSKYQPILGFPNDIAAAAKAIAEGRGDILTMTSLDFLQMRQTTVLEPLAIMSKSDRAVESYLLLVPVGMNFDKLARKPQRKLMVEQGGGGDVAKVWLSTQLMERGLAPVADFFTAIHVAKPNRAILPLFFGQADACVVTEGAYTVMIELNPQMEQKVSILGRSPGFVNLLICETENLDPYDKQRVLEELAGLNDNPMGQQALTIMQMDRFFLFDPDYLKATEVLYDRHNRMMDKQN